MEKKSEGGYVSIAGKISLWSYGRLVKILRKKGITIYQMIQNVADCFIRNTDDRHNLTPESEKIMATFEHMQGWKDNFNLADHTAQPEVSEATYYLTSEGKKGVRVMHVEKPFFGIWRQNFNIQQILERFLCLTFPSLYRRMRFIAVCRDCGSIFELLCDIIAECEREEEKRELLRDFEDNDNSDFGVKPKQGGPYRRHHGRTLDMFEEHERRKAESDEQDIDDDPEHAKEWLEKNMPFKPFGYEW